MGGSSSTQYPAAVLGGLFQGANNSFSLNPQGANAAWGGANSAINNTLASSNLNNSPFGFNPWATAGTGANLQGAALNALPYAYSAYGALTPYAGGAAQSGQNAYNTLTGMGNQVISQGAAPLGALEQAGNRAYQAGLAPLAGLERTGNRAYGTGVTEANQLFPYVSQALQQGFDPQHALYNKLFQQQQDQGRAENAASGVGTTPYGAGLQQTNNQNFDIAWQQAQLANQAQGANTASQLVGSGMGAIGTGQGVLSGLYGTGQQGFQTGANILQGLYGTGQQGLFGGANAAANLYGTGSNALNQGLGTASNLYGQGLQGIEGILGAAGGAATTGTNLSALPAQLQGQLGTQELQNYLNYIGASNQGAAGYFGAANNSFGQTNNLYGQQQYGNLQNQQLQNQGLSGIGSLLGQLGGGYLSGGYA